VPAILLALALQLIPMRLLKEGSRTRCGWRRHEPHIDAYPRMIPSRPEFPENSSSAPFGCQRQQRRSLMRPGFWLRPGPCSLLLRSHWGFGSLHAAALAGRPRPPTPLPRKALPKQRSDHRGWLRRDY